MKVNLARVIEWTIAALLILAVFTTISWNTFFSYVSKPFLWIRTGIYRVGETFLIFGGGILKAKLSMRRNSWKMRKRLLKALQIVFFI